ncbi:hypothetical protein [Paraburkholderia domus]|uniref:TubC N-terminal docking domain-related protein n=1 Tax=Paraburkholderia domus TaxID=2793075 RepID=UPI0019123690|nr:hypothetical protein [Paraburkholderia domus]MBK5179102.1 hypothetical protein [Burkholderia sp. R-69749]CAE6747380.1 hypothetical protein R69749_00181 [Paraburkholderia domus]
MSIAQILTKAQTMGVRLRIDGDRVKIAGPAPAVASIKPEIAAHKPEIMAHLRAAANDAADYSGALHSLDGGLYLPWGPYLSPDDVRRMRGKLVAMIEQLADMEHWDAGRRDDVLTRAIRGPLADLMPNIHRFNARLSEARAEAESRAALDRRTWHGEGFDDRRLR